jgi:hypothetical protein
VESICKLTALDGAPDVAAEREAARKRWRERQKAARMTEAAGG